MNRIFLALVLLILCFSVAVFGFLSLEKSCAEIEKSLQSAASLIESGKHENALKELEGVSIKWENERLIFNIFLDHTTLDTLDSSLPSLSKIFKSGDDDKTFEEIQKSIAVLDDIVEEQRINVGNIL